MTKGLEKPPQVVQEMRKKDKNAKGPTSWVVLGNRLRFFSRSVKIKAENTDI
jgi:hypothetical protein